MSEPRRGEVRWGAIGDVGRRPFLVMTRGIPTEVGFGPDDGIPTDCAVPKAYLVERVCALDTARMFEACRALRAAVDC